MSDNVKIPINEPYDLSLTLYPSFNLAFFERRGNVWVKVVGSHLGLQLSLKEHFLSANINDTEVILNYSGLWFNPTAYIGDVYDRFKDVVLELIRFYGKLRLSINPYDKEAMFVTIVLSQRTDFHVNVVRWVKKIFSKEKPDFNIGRSYQLRRAREAYSSCIEILRKDSMKEYGDLWSLRKDLLSKCRNVGVKTADAYLLFTRRNATWLAPVDIHFRRFIHYIFNVKKESPRKNYCTKYLCHKCPFKDKCATYWALKSFGKLAGWIQTVAYVHDKLYCSKRKCGICPLSRFCRGRLD